MTPKLTTRVVRWSATAYGALLAFQAASQFRCTKREDFLFADEVRRQTRRSALDLVDGFSELANMDHRTDAFEESCAAFDLWQNVGCEKTEFAFTPSCWRWIKDRMDEVQDGGYFASCRLRLYKSLEDAQEIDVGSVV